MKGVQGCLLARQLGGQVGAWRQQRLPVVLAREAGERKCLLP